MEGEVKKASKEKRRTKKPRSEEHNLTAQSEEKIEMENMIKLTAADKVSGAKKSKKKSSKDTVKDSVSAADNAEVSGPTLEQLQLRAYFIAERRRELGLPGDATSDWVQAERELVPS